MPVIKTKGAGSAQGFGEFTQAGPKVYIEDVFSTYLYTGNSALVQVNNGLPIGSNTATSGGGLATTACRIYCVSTLPSQFGTGDFTVECFFYLTASVSATYGAALVTQWTGAADGDSAWGLRLDVNGKITTSTYNTLLSTSASAPSLGAWHHVAWARSGSSNAVWIDGTRVNSYTNSFDYSRAVNCNFTSDGQGVPGAYFTGAMSNIRLVKGSAVYNPSSTTITVPTSALTAVTNTSLLIFQGTAPLVDNSLNGYGMSYTTGGGYVAPQTTTFGPFVATTGVVAKGGLVWIKNRTGAQDHNLFDTTRTRAYVLHSDTTDAQIGVPVNYDITTFNTNGFTLGISGYGTNDSGSNYASWSFVKQPKFFDVVTYTGTGASSQTISHSLASVPGFIAIKRTDSTGDWVVIARDNSGQYYCLQNATTPFGFNSTNAATGPVNFVGLGYLSSTAMLPYVFGGGNSSSSGTNISGATYVAYLWAHNAGGFGLTGTDNVISCGSFTTDGSSTFSVTLGYEPQWVMIKASSTTGPWYMVDSMRGFITTGVDNVLYANLSSAEGATGVAYPTATGFAGTGQLNVSQTFIYIAIRRGPMRTPTLGTSVFSPVSRAGTSANALVTANFPVDLSFIGESTGATYDKFLTTDRLRGTSASLETRATFAEFTATNAFQTNAFDSNVALKIGTGNDTNSSTTNYANWLFARAPGFFDEVCSAAGLGGTYRNHNLGAVPELIIGKSRTTSQNWCVGASLIGWNKSLYLNLTNAAGSDTVWGSGTNNPTSTQFYSALNSGEVYYLFATLAGVSKVGSYTGTGASQVINCGFTSGARFVMIKRTDSTGDWYVYDTARGMVSGTDPYLFMNSLAAQVNADYVFTSSTGFTIQAAAPAGINANGGTYIFLAIA